MLNTAEIIILTLITIALIVAGPLLIAEGAAVIIHDAAVRAWNDFADFNNWLMNAIDQVIFGGPSGSKPVPNFPEEDSMLPPRETKNTTRP